MERFIFDSKPFLVCGIDENGYGPLLGPLVVTVVELEVKGDDPLSASEMMRYRFPLPVKDSKDVFKRSLKSYMVGESVVLSLFEFLGFKFSSLSEILLQIGKPRVNLRDYGIQDVAIPAFGGKINERLLEFFQVASIRPFKILSRIAMADVFNEMVLKLENKALMDLALFLDLARNVESEVILAGKVGGTTRYGPFLEKLVVPYEVLKESFSQSSYRIWGKKVIHFLMDGDRKFLPIALSSLVGKYLRELIMLAISHEFGFKEDIPYVSGYYHDPKTYQLVSKMSDEMKKKWLRIK